MVLLRDLATRQHAAEAANHRALGFRAAAGHLASDHRAGNAADNRALVGRTLAIALTLNLSCSRALRFNRATLSRRNLGRAVIPVD